MNKIAKAILFLGSRIEQIRESRIGRAILDNFNKMNEVITSGGSHRRLKAHKDIEVVVGELVKTRKHSKFPHPKNILEAKDRKELLD